MKNEVRCERNEKSCKSCSRSSLLDQFQDRETNHVDGRNSYDLLIYYMFYFMKFKDPLSMRLRTWRVEGGEAGVLEFLHHEEDELHL